MSQRIIFTSLGAVLLIVALYAVVSQSARGQVAAVANQAQWEYKVIDESQGAHGGAASIQNALTKLGRDGWELCDSTSDVFSQSANSQFQTRLYFILKRPKQ
jgi:hypothetical protein